MGFMQKIIRFMSGRYGNDALNVALCVLGCVITLVLSFFHIGWFKLFTYVPFLVAVFRMMSKNFEKRRKENALFMKFWTPWSVFFSKKYDHFKDKEHRYFDCPVCHRTLRVPSGRGKIEITCPFCGKKFKKRT